MPSTTFAAGGQEKFDGDTDKLGAEFTYRYKDFHRTKQKSRNSVGKRVVLARVRQQS